MKIEKIDDTYKLSYDGELKTTFVDPDPTSLHTFGQQACQPGSLESKHELYAQGSITIASRHILCYLTEQECPVGFFSFDLPKHIMIEYESGFRNSL